MEGLLERLQSHTLEQYLERIPVIGVFGARQVGKTTLVRDLLKEKRAFFTLDDPTVGLLIEQNPISFLEQHSRMTIDEAQKSPSLFPAIKRIVDKKRTPGQFIITGSANITMLPKISETLAGRIAFIEMTPLSILETSGSIKRQPGLIGIMGCRSAQACWEKLRDIEPKQIPFERDVFRGGLPPAYREENDQTRQAWFKGYIKTYLERDVRDLSRIQRLYEYQKFLTLLAYRCAQILNRSELARDCGIPYTTAGHFFDLLLATFQIFLVEPLYKNIGKRLIKAPKVMWNDTGLAMHLQGLNTWEDACRLGRDSFLIENRIAIELRTYLSAYEPAAKLYYWRTSAGAEVDFVIEKGGQLIPIEVKWREVLNAKSLVSMNIFLKDFKDICPWGMVVYRGKELLKASDNLFLVPFEYLFQ